MSIKKTAKQGFTIVELLIVIVVIGILATIVIVTYQGVQNKANTTKNQTNAREVKDKAESYNSLKTHYPASKAVFTSTADAEVAGVVKVSKQVEDALKNDAATSGEGRTGITYEVCGPTDTPTGAKITYYSFETKELVPPEVVGECN